MALLKLTVTFSAVMSHVTHAKNIGKIQNMPPFLTKYCTRCIYKECLSISAQSKVTNFLKLSGFWPPCTIPSRHNIPLKCALVRHCWQQRGKLLLIKYVWKNSSTHSTLLQVMSF